MEKVGQAIGKWQMTWDSHSLIAQKFRSKPESAGQGMNLQSTGAVEIKQEMTILANVPSFHYFQKINLKKNLFFENSKKIIN